MPVVEAIDLVDIYSDFIVRESREPDRHEDYDVEEFDIHDLLAETYHIKYNDN